jgi:hypothetical protein
MSQIKLLAFHVEGATAAELKKNVEAGLAELGKVAGGKTEAADSEKGKAGKTGKAGKGKSATTIEQVKEGRSRR